jgi:hypothetical protein
VGSYDSSAIYDSSQTYDLLGASVTFTPNTNAGSLQWATYLDLEEDVKPWIQVPFYQSTADYQLQLLTDMTCTWVQRKLGQPLAPTQFTRYFDGWSGFNGAFLQLPYYPVLEITSVTEFWGKSGPHVLNESVPTNQVDGWQCEYLQGMLRRVFPGLVEKPWFPGSRNIEISWTAGYNPVPADIKVATLEMISHWWRNTQQQAGRRPGGPGGEYDPEVVAMGLWTGVPLRITTLLESYMQIGIA